MQTVYDWVTLAMFCGLVTLFLQRSVGPALPGDRVIKYVPAALGCAVGNYLGNEGHDLAAILIIAVTLCYATLVLRPGRASGDA